MSSRHMFEALQNRWVIGEPLSAAEERARLSQAEVDPLAARELELFEELSTRLAGPAEPASSAEVAKLVAGARGIPLRVVGSDEGVPSTRRRSRRVATFVGLVLAAAAGFALYTQLGARGKLGKPAFLHAQTPPPRSFAITRSELVFASGDVRIEGRPSTIGGAPLKAGARVSTGDGHACVTIDPAVDVCLAPHSEIELESLRATELKVRVLLGGAVAELTTRAPGHTFALLAGGLTATARGTVFAVLGYSSWPNWGSVMVLEGEVGVQGDRTPSEVLAAHQGLRFENGWPRAKDSVGRAEEASVRALLEPNRLWQQQNLGMLVLEDAPAGSKVWLDTLGPFTVPFRSFVGAGTHEVTVRTPSGAELTLKPEVEAGKATRVAGAEPERPGELATPPSASLLLDEAREKLKYGNVRGARAVYERLRTSYPTSPEARTVLVTLGKLELELRAPARALGAFDAYVKQGGALLPEALAGRIRALRALGRRVEERQAIVNYLERYPRGLEAPALEKRLSSLTAP